jgi:glutamine synthetase adenylyltransferase
LKLLERAGVLPAAHASALKEALRFLRTVEKVLRRQEERARTGLPSDPRALKALARAVGFSDGNAFQQALREGMAETRAIFQAHLETS